MPWAETTEHLSKNYRFSAFCPSYFLYMSLFVNQTGWLRTSSCIITESVVSFIFPYLCKISKAFQLFFQSSASSALSAFSGRSALRFSPKTKCELHLNLSPLSSGYKVLQYLFFLLQGWYHFPFLGKTILNVIFWQQINLESLLSVCFEFMCWNALLICLLLLKWCCSGCIVENNKACLFNLSNHIIYNKICATFNVISLLLVHF